MLGACCYFQHDFNSPPVRSRLYSACSTQATSTVRAIGAIAAQFTLVILIAMQLAYTSAACVHRKMAIKVVTHFLEVIDGLLSMPSLGCIPSLVKIGSGNAHCLLAGVHETLESSHQAQWPRGGHISHVFLLYSTVSWPSFIKSIHAFELS